ncbi:unnamed protein product [Umbelopsis ramanniana]
MYQKRNEGVNGIIVDKASIQDVVDMIQAATAATSSSTPFSQPDEILKENLSQMTLDDEVESIDVSQYLKVVDAFSMPSMQYDYHRKGFVQSSEKPSLLSSSDAKGDIYRDRFNLIRQRVLRNDSFLPPSLQIIDSDSYLKITPIKSLIGHDNEQFLLLGMLTQIEEGKVYLEDNDAHVELDLSRCKSTVGLFTDNCFILVEGVYGDDHIFHVDELGLPPPESRTKTTSVFGHIDFLGLPPLNIEESVLLREEKMNTNISFVIISDLWLDQPKILRAFRQLLEGYSRTIVPLAFILSGNFVSQPLMFSGTESAKYRESFNLLADTIAEFPNLASHSYFIFVPGANDPWAGNTLPRPPIPDFFTARLRQKVKRAIFTSNPARIKYCTQEIVVFREDLLNRLRRNTLIQGDNPQDDRDLTKPLIRTIVDQAHLCPLPLSIRPIYCAYDHALRLYPMPDVLILADRCDNYSTNYEGCHCINPGSFPNSDLNWTTYYPAIRDSERWYVVMHRR